MLINGQNQESVCLMLVLFLFECCLVKAVFSKVSQFCILLITFQRVSCSSLVALYHYFENVQACDLAKNKQCRANMLVIRFVMNQC